MKKIVSFLTVILIVLGSCVAFATALPALASEDWPIIGENPPFLDTTADTFEMRYGAHFGWSKKDVINAEPHMPRQNNDSNVIFEDTVCGLDALIAYYFENNSLDQVSIVFTEEYDKGNSYFDDFFRVDSELIEKYSEPNTRNLMTWDNDKYKDTRSEWGKALLLDHCTISTGWVGVDVVIVHSLEYKNDAVMHQIIYFTFSQDGDEATRTDI